MNISTANVLKIEGDIGRKADRFVGDRFIRTITKMTLGSYVKLSWNGGDI